MAERKNPGKTPRPSRKGSARKAKIDVDAVIARVRGTPLTPEAKQRLSSQSGVDSWNRTDILVLSNEDPEEYKDWVGRWMIELGAEGGPELFAAKSAAHASWQLRRLEKAIGAWRELARRHAERAENKFWEREEHDVLLLSQRLAENPTEVVMHLRQTAPGCRWLISQWRFLDCLITGDGGLYPSQQLWATQLLGFLETGPEAFQYWLAGKARGRPAPAGSTLLREVIRETIAELEGRATQLTEAARACWLEEEEWTAPDITPYEKRFSSQDKLYRREIRDSIKMIQSFREIRGTSAARSEGPDEAGATD
jgi:hypothetical protein